MRQTATFHLGDQYILSERVRRAKELLSKGDLLISDIALAAGFHNAYRGGHGRERDRHPFQSLTLGLAVQGLMLAVLLEHDHRQQAWAGPASCNGME